MSLMLRFLRKPRWLSFSALLLLCLLAPSVSAGTTLNMSHDLVALGIAAQNMVPNVPTQDARPLFAAAVQYARTHGITLITVDTGAYYFLTSDSTSFYLFFGS